MRLKSSRLRPMGLGGRAPDAATILQLFSKKKYTFLGVVWSKFCVFKWLNKVLMRPKGATRRAKGLKPPSFPLSQIKVEKKDKKF